MQVHAPTLGAAPELSFYKLSGKMLTPVNYVGPPHSANFRRWAEPSFGNTAGFGGFRRQSARP
jgi:hypothetical protein